MRGDGYLAVAIVTAAPTAPAVTRNIQLQPTGSRHYVVTGTAVGNNIILPDATLCPLGAVIKVENASSEFIGLHLYGTAAYLTRIPPRGVARVTLTANATAAGTWFGGCTDLGAECRGNLVLYGNFATYAASGSANDGGYHFASGTGALCRSSSSTDEAVAATMGFLNSWCYIYTGTTNGGYAMIRYGSSSTPSGWKMTAGPYAYEAKFSLDALPTAAEDWIVRLGFFGPSGNENCQLTLDRTIGGGTNYYLDASVGGVHTTTNSGVVAVARTPTTMRVEKTRAGDRQDLWINGVWRCQSAGGPTTYATAQAMAYGIATAGGTTRALALGYHRVIHAPATPIV
jgi:hypothetical protein